MSFNVMLFLWSLVILLPVVPTKAVCSNGITYSAVLRDIRRNMYKVCQSEFKTVNFVLRRSRFVCCAFDLEACKNARDIYKYFYIEKQQKASVHNMCFYNFFIAFYTLCDCDIKTTTSPPPTTDQVCGISELTSVRASPIVPYIINGENAKKCEFPWVAFYQVGYHQCSAVIFDSRHVLTVAHCATLAEKDQMIIGLGSVDMEKFPQVIRIEKVIVHPNFRSNQFGLYNDIAILRLSEEIVFTKCVRPICFSDKTRAINDTETCIVAGWGKNRHGKLQRFLQKVDIPILSDRKCQRYVKDYQPGQICAGYLEGGKDSCEGDSGGPLMCLANGRWIVEGLVSFGKYCALPYNPGVYTDVRYYMKWITDNVHCE